MVISPIQNEGLLKTDWIQSRPRVSQWFGMNKAMYEPFGMKGHNGVDFAVIEGTPVYAPLDGEAVVKEDKTGYGTHIRIRNPYKKLECVLGHLSSVLIKNGQKVTQGQMIGKSGNTGFSTGPHVHMGLRALQESKGSVWEWGVEGYDNGYFGYWDFSPYVITYKGTLQNTSL
jgi:murein DD-endopeptidase MepM/ murein hydrolase activator NlpD